MELSKYQLNVNRKLICSIMVKFSWCEQDQDNWVLPKKKEFKGSGPKSTQWQYSVKNVLCLMIAPRHAEPTEFRLMGPGVWRGGASFLKPINLRN